MGRGKATSKPKGKVTKAQHSRYKGKSKATTRVFRRPPPTQVAADEFPRLNNGFAELLNGTKILPFSSPLLSKAPWHNKPYATLSEDLQLLVDYLTPSAPELKVHQALYRQVETLIRSRYPNACVIHFGSSSCSLATFRADLDFAVEGIISSRTSSSSAASVIDLTSDTENSTLNIITSNRRLPASKSLTVSNLRELAQVIRSKTRWKVKTRTHAKTPINWMKDENTGIEMDLKLGVEPQMFYVERLMKRYAKLRPLSMVLKEILLQKKIDKAYAGGVGSFKLYLMLAYFLEKLEHSEMTLFGCFVGFCYYFGSQENLNVWTKFQVQIDVNDTIDVNFKSAFNLHKVVGVLYQTYLDLHASAKHDPVRSNGNKIWASCFSRVLDVPRLERDRVEALRAAQDTTFSSRVTGPITRRTKQRLMA